MSLTRIYKYRIREGAEEKYLALQAEVLRLYRRHAEVEVLFLRDSKDSAAKTEVLRFFGSSPQADMQKIDADPQVMELFNFFRSEILDPGCPAIHEETLFTDALSAASKLHHVELYCSNLDKSQEFWSWFLSNLGYKQFQKWPDGISFKLADTYVVLVQAGEKHLASTYNRCQPGLNHLAFHATDRKQVDELTMQLRARGARILYEDRHPHAGGAGSYAVFFEDPERIKVELVAPKI